MLRTSLKGYTKAISIIILLVLSLSPALNAAGEKESINIYVPAVTNSGGAIIKIGISMNSNGSGSLFLRGVPSVGNDTLYSSIVAFYSALLLSNRDPLSYDGELVFESDLSGIEGPSASLAIAEAFYVLSSGRPSPPMLGSAVVTGAVSLDGMSIIIGGVAEKLAAACSSGAREFILPTSNYLSSIDQINSNCSNIKILPASGIISLYSQLMGYGIINTTSFQGIFTYPPQISDVMGEVAMKYLEKSELLNPLVRNSSDANSIIASISTGKNYTAASLAVSLYVSSLRAALQSNTTSLESARQYLSNLNTTIQALKAELGSIEQTAIEKGSIPIPLLETLATAESRLWLAESYVSQGLAASNLSDAIYAAANSNGRIEAARTWIELSKIDWSNYPSLSPAQLIGGLNDYEKIAKAALSYASSLASDMGFQYYASYFQVLNSMFAQASSINQPSKLFLKYALYSELTAEISSFILSTNIQSEKSLQYYINEANLVYSILFSNILRNGLITAVTPAYMEYSAYGNLSDDSRLMLIDSAISWTIPLLFISLHEHVPASQPIIRTVFPLEGTIASVLIAWALAGILSSLLAIVSYRAIRRSP
ncbi:MAG: S16 family serine protease [Fervidicoccaceae archaeon]